MARGKINLRRAARHLWEQLGGRRPVVFVEKDAAGKTVATSARTWHPGDPEQEPDAPYMGTTGEELRPEIEHCVAQGWLDGRARFRVTWVLVNKVKRGTDPKGGMDHTHNGAPAAAYHATFWYLCSNTTTGCIAADHQLDNVLARGGIVRWMRVDLFRPSRGYTMDRSGAVVKESETPRAQAERERRRQRRTRQTEEKKRLALLEKTRAGMEAEAKKKAKEEAEAKAQAERARRAEEAEREAARLRAELEAVKRRLAKAKKTKAKKAVAKKTPKRVVPPKRVASKKKASKKKAPVRKAPARAKKKAVVKRAPPKKTSKRVAPKKSAPRKRSRR